jgi:hypothetical protein
MPRARFYVNVDDASAYQRFAFSSWSTRAAIRIYQACTEGKVFLTEAMSGFGKTSVVRTARLAHRGFQFGKPEGHHE